MGITRDKTGAGTGLIVLAFIAFISLGLPDGLLGVAWPSIRDRFSLPLDSLGVLLFAVTTGYLVSSFSSGYLIRKLGIGELLAFSCVITGVSLIGYTLVPAWWMLIACGMTAGLGAGAIDAGINTYVASNFGDRLMQWLHASWGIGITLGPLIMTAGINLFHTWRWGYAIVGSAQILLGVYFALTSSRWRGDGRSESGESERTTDHKTPYRETLRCPGVWLSMLMFFLYTGVEATLGAWAYTLLTESRGISSGTAGLLTGSYWATFTIGRVLAGLYTKRVGGRTLISVSLLGAIGGSIFLWWNPAKGISLLSVAIIGFAIAPIFPGLVSGTVGRVGSRHAVNTIGMQIGAAGMGMAILPGFAGVLAQRTSLEVIPVCLTLFAVALLGLHTISPRSGETGQGNHDVFRIK